MIDMAPGQNIPKNRLGLVGLRAAMFVLLMLTAHSLWAATAGVVLASRGEVYATRPGGDTRSLATASRIYSGDLIRTGRRAAVQLRFNDGTLIALKENTEFRVDEYEHDTQNNSLSKAFYSLLKGGFRSVTSLLTASNKRAYRVSTSMATIGIRGTDYEATLCEGACPGTSAGGLHLEVFEGAIEVNNQAGAFELSGGELGFVPNVALPLHHLPKGTEQAPAGKHPITPKPDGTTGDSSTTGDAGGTEDPNSPINQDPVDDDTLLDPTAGTIDAEPEFQSGEALICIKK